MQMYAGRNDVLQINEICVFCMHMLYMLLKCNFVLENKSLISAGEFWEAEPWEAVGDKEYAHLSRPCFLACFRWGFLFYCLRRTPLGDL